MASQQRHRVLVTRRVPQHLGRRWGRGALAARGTGPSSRAGPPGNLRPLANSVPSLHRLPWFFFLCLQCFANVAHLWVVGEGCRAGVGSKGRRVCALRGLSVITWLLCINPALPQKPAPAGITRGQNHPEKTQVHPRGTDNPLLSQWNCQLKWKSWCECGGCAGTGVGFDDPCVSLPAQDILRLYEMTKGQSKSHDGHAVVC